MTEKLQLIDMAKECPAYEANLENCPCDSEDCERRGLCCQCVAHHRASGKRPACMR